VVRPIGAKKREGWRKESVRSEGTQNKGKSYQQEEGDRLEKEKVKPRSSGVEDLSESAVQKKEAKSTIMTGGFRHILPGPPTTEQKS